MKNHKIKYLLPMLAAPLAAHLATPETAQAQERARRPNVVLLYADDLGYGDLSCYACRKWTALHQRPFGSLHKHTLALLAADGRISVAQAGD